MTAKDMFSHRVSILTGHYGTGKTEVSVNLALALAAEGEQVMLADLDIVEPLFPLSGAAAPPGKSRCAGDFLLPGLFGRGCPRPAGGAAGHSGGPVHHRDSGYRRRSGGARVLARFLPKIQAEDLPASLRTQRQPSRVRTPEAAVRYLRGIEQTTGLTCTGLVNNTHLCGETTPAEIRKGAALAQEVSRQTGIPILCHTAERRFLESLSDLGEPVFPIAINMKKPWER